MLRGRAEFLTGSLGLSSSLAEKSSLFRSLSGSLGSSSGFAERSSLFRSLSGFLDLAGSRTRGQSFAENLQGKFNPTTVLSGHYDCHENLIANCGTVSASFAFLVVALGVLIFSIYAAKQRWQSPRLQEELEPEEVIVDKEGWETKASEDEERKERKGSGNEQS
jgi:hypothetical protein